MLVDLNKEDLQVLNVLLMEAPYKVAAPLVAKINAQLAQQVHPKSETAEDAEHHV